MTKVLVVDDDSRIRNLLVAELTELGYETIEAENGAIALDRVYTDRPDIVLLDQTMPILDGMQVLKVLRFNDQTADIPVVLLTAVSAVEREQEALEAGANHYVTKPWKMGVIPTVIRVALREAGKSELIIAPEGPVAGPVEGTVVGTIEGKGAGDPTQGVNGPGEPMDSGETAIAGGGVGGLTNGIKGSGGPVAGERKTSREGSDDLTNGINRPDEPMDAVEEGGPGDNGSEDKGQQTGAFDWGEEITNPPRQAEKKKIEDSLFLTTGYPLLDLKLGGGVPREGLTYIEGVASTGKSVLSQHFAYAGLTQGYRVSYFCSQRSPSGLISQMASLGMDTSHFHRDGRLTITAIPAVDPSGEKSSGLPDLIRRVKEMASEIQFIVIDDLTGIISGEQGSTVVSFLQQCKALGNSGNSIVVAANPDAMSDEALLLIRSLSDVYLGLGVEKTGTRIKNVLEVFKVSNAEFVTGNRVNFDIEPGLGIRVNAFSKVNG